MTEAATQTTSEDTADNADQTTPEVDENTDAETGDDSEPISLEKARQLRTEAKGLRERAKTAEARVAELEDVSRRNDELARRLHTALTAATGKLADPTDLAFDAAHLDDADKLTEAIDKLVESKPHLKARRLSGDIGQGRAGSTDQPFSFTDRLKQSV